MINFLKKYKNNIGIFLTYLLLSFIYFIYPITHKLLIADGDGFYSYFPLKMYYASFLKGGIHLWLPYQFLGESFLGSLQTGILYPVNFMYLFASRNLVPYIFNFNLILHYALAGFFMYLFLKNLKLKGVSSFMGGLIFAFAGFLMAHRGHISVQNAAIWLPLILLFYERIKSTLNIRYAIYASFIIAIQIFAGFFQVSLYTYMILFLYTIYFFFADKFYLKKDWLKYLIYCGLPIALGAVLASPQLISTFEMSKYSMRSGINYDFFTEFSMPPLTIVSMVIPFLFGGAYSIPHWASYQRAEMGAFIGIAPFIIAVATGFLFFRKNKNVLFWSVISILGLFLCFGRYNPLYKFFYYLPIYNLFRVPARNVFEFDFALITLFSIGINYILTFKKEGAEILNKIIYAFSFIIFFIYLLSTIGKTFGFASAPTISNFLGANGLTLVGQIFITKSKVLFIPFVFASFYLIWFFLLNKKIVKTGFFVIIFIIAIFTESYSFGMIYDASWPKISEVKQYFNSDLTKFLSKTVGSDRVVFVNQENPSLLGMDEKVNSLNGYDSLLNSNLHQLLDIVQNGASPNWQDLLSNNLILSSLGVKYVVIPKKSNIDLSRYTASTSQENVTYKNIPLTKNWETENVTESGGDHILKSPDVNVLTLIQQKIILKKNTYYLLTISARKLKEDPMYPLILGIYGGKMYDNAEQNFNIDSSIFSLSSQTYSKIINTGDSLPDEGVYIRAYTYSRTPIAVGDITVKEVENYHIPYLGPNNIRVGDMPIYKKIYETNSDLVYENINSLSRAYSVSKLEASENILDTKSRFYSLSIDPSKTALLSSQDLKFIGKTNFDKGEVKIDSYNSDDIKLSVSFKNDDGFLVIADQFYPGWKAYIDGKETKIYQVNNLLRGIRAGKGIHQIVFKYSPTNLYVSTGIGVFLLICCFIVIKKSKKNE